MRNLSEVIGFKEVVVEGRSYKSTFAILKEAIDKGNPVTAGALDMYYLHYYPSIYRKTVSPSITSSP
ncbi:MAG: hypothetical protein ACUVQ8_07775 [Nitrososphaeria archaeon]